MARHLEARETLQLDMVPAAVRISLHLAPQLAVLVLLASSSSHGWHNFMTKTYAIIKNGIVSNTILWDAEAQPDYAPEGTPVDVSSISPQPGPGWTYDGTNFTDPNAQPPVENGGGE